MTKAQRTAYKAENRQRRAVEEALARQADPKSKTSLRKRFDRLHAEWRAAAGLDGNNLSPGPVYAARSRGPAAPPEGGGPGGVDDERNP